jgi:hypothetical protein
LLHRLIRLFHRGAFLLHRLMELFHRGAKLFHRLATLFCFRLTVRLVKLFGSSIPALLLEVPAVVARGWLPGFSVLPLVLSLFILMPSEHSFADRIGRFVLLKEACEDMSPVFAPPDSDISVAAQAALIVTLNACCTNVADAETNLKEATDGRVEMVKGMKALTTRAVNRVASNRVWAGKLELVKKAADRVRGMKPPRPKLPAPPSDPEEPAPKKLDRGGEGYRDVESHFHKFMAALGKCSGYDTGAPADITLTSLDVALTTLRETNDAVPGLEVSLRELQIERLRVFQSKKPLPDGSAPLRDRWARIKKAVKSQYGTDSAQYELVAPIKY